MGAVWLHDLPEWLAQDPALRVRYYPGWELRSRSTGGFDAVRAIGIHHTASPRSSSTANDLSYMWQNASAKPIGNIYLARDGEVVVGVAGASNTMGRGGPLTTSKGTIPMDTGNRYMLAIEAANDGRGEIWPDVQMEAYVRLVAVLVRNLGLDPRRDVFSHAAYCEPSCPGRKVDPSGPTPLYPSIGGVSGNVTWPDAAFGEQVVRMVTGDLPGPAPTPGLWPGTPLPVLVAGASGPEPARLIGVLKFWRWYPAEYIGDTNDGVIGPRAQAGIRAMQTALGCTATGVYDVPTAEAYSLFAAAMSAMSCSLPGAPLGLGDSGPRVGDLQTFLAGRGWYRSVIDSRYGPITAQGVQQLQRACRTNGFDPGPIDGLYGPRTRAAACQLVSHGG